MSEVAPQSATRAKISSAFYWAGSDSAVSYYRWGSDTRVQCGGPCTEGDVLPPSFSNCRPHPSPQIDLDSLRRAGSTHTHSYIFEKSSKHGKIWEILGICGEMEGNEEHQGSIEKYRVFPSSSVSIYLCPSGPLRSLHFWSESARRQVLGGLRWE